MQHESYRCETAFKFRLEENTIPTLEAADALGDRASWVIADGIVAHASISDVDVAVTAKKYDDQINGAVEYDVKCDFTIDLPYIELNEENVKNLAFYVGTDVADSFEFFGHKVIDFEETKNCVKAIDETNDAVVLMSKTQNSNRRQHSVERG